MKKILFITVTLGGMLFFSCQKNEIPDDTQNLNLITSSSQVIEGKYIVVNADFCCPLRLIQMAIYQAIPMEIPIQSHIGKYSDDTIILSHRESSTMAFLFN